jgi:hypothetical protein
MTLIASLRIDRRKALLIGVAVAVALAEAVRARIE